MTPNQIAIWAIFVCIAIPLIYVAVQAWKQR